MTERLKLYVLDSSAVLQAIEPSKYGQVHPFKCDSFYFFPDGVVFYKYGDQERFVCYALSKAEARKTFAPYERILQQTT